MSADPDPLVAPVVGGTPALKVADRVWLVEDIEQHHRIVVGTVKSISRAGYVRVSWDTDFDVSHFSPATAPSALRVVTGRDALPRHDWDVEKTVESPPCRCCGVIQTDVNEFDACDAALVPRPEPREPEPPICTFCARGVPGFQLQSGTGNLWHRNEAGQLFKCVGGPTAAVRSASAPADHSSCHDVACSGNRSYPRGEPGHSCSCRGRDQRNLEAASAPSLEQVIAQKDAAYAERDQLVAALSKLWPSHLARHPDEDVTWENDWRWIVCIHSPVGQLTWHIHDSEREQFDHLDALRGDWDGHTTEEKYARLKSLSASLVSGGEPPQE